MIWFILAALVVLVVALAVLAFFRPPPLDDKTYAVLIELHAIRRRLEVAQFKGETRREAAHARRALRDDLEPKPRRRRQGRRVT